MSLLLPFYPSIAPDFDTVAGPSSTAPMRIASNSRT